MTSEARLNEILTQLYQLYHQEIDLSLDRVIRFLHRIGDPHLTLPRVVHVAGTNGKGSVIATLRALLESSGNACHVMTSPHLVHPAERIRLAGKLISTEDLVALLEECLAVNHDEPITFFEMFTAATFLAFSRMPADYALLETGMGGRLDATNVVPDPGCTVITAISKDHERFLGDTLAKIAFEKAGIMKAGVPCVISRQSEEAIEAGVMEVFKKQSASLSPDAPLLISGEHWASAPESDRMMFRYETDSILSPRPSLLGSHQIDNAGAAIAAYRVIEGHLPDAEILSTAMRNIDWPGRLQTLENSHFQNLLPEEWEIWIDGGHNDSAGQVLAEQAADWVQEDAKPLHLIVAMVDRKDPATFLKPLVPYAESLTVIPIPDEPSSFDADILYEKVSPLGFKEVRKAENVEVALKSLTSHPPGRVLITGSLYLVGRLLKSSSYN